MRIGKCIVKFRNKANQFYMYRIQFNDGHLEDTESKRLKMLMRNNQIRVENLKLTYDSCIVDIVKNMRVIYEF